MTNQEQILKHVETMEAHFSSGLMLCSKVKALLAAGAQTRPAKKSGLSKEEAASLVINLQKSFVKQKRAI